MASRERADAAPWNGARGHRSAPAQPGWPRRFLTWIAPIIAIGGAVVLALVVIVNTLS
jgi:hypothetical protein